LNSPEPTSAPAGAGWESVPCPVCGAREAAPVLDLPHPDAPGGLSRVVQCAGCGLRRLEPRPTMAVIGKYYGGGYNAFIGRTRGAAKQARWDFLRDSGAGAPGRGAGARLLRPFTRPFADWAFDITIPLDGGKPPRVIEIGCGYGDLLMYLKSRGCEVQGVDMDPGAAAVGAQHGVPIHVGHVTDLKLPAGSFDRAVMCHSLEHVPDPREQLAELARLLRPGGVLHIAVPNGKSAGLRLEGRAWLHLSHPLHLWFFDSLTLKRLAGECGFVPRLTYTTSRHHQLGKVRERARLRGWPAALRETARLLAAHAGDPDSGDVLRLQAVRLG